MQTCDFISFGQLTWSFNSVDNGVEIIFPDLQIGDIPSYITNEAGCKMDINVMKSSYVYDPNFDVLPTQPIVNPNPGDDFYAWDNGLQFHSDLNLDDGSNDYDTYKNWQMYGIFFGNELLEQKPNGWDFRVLLEETLPSREEFLQWVDGGGVDVVITFTSQANGYALCENRLSVVESSSADNGAITKVIAEDLSDHTITATAPTLSLDSTSGYDVVVTPSFSYGYIDGWAHSIDNIDYTIVPVSNLASPDSETISFSSAGAKTIYYRDYTIKNGAIKLGEKVETLLATLSSETDLSWLGVYDASLSNISSGSVQLNITNLVTNTSLVPGTHTNLTGGNSVQAEFYIYKDSAFTGSSLGDLYLNNGGNNTYTIDDNLVWNYGSLPLNGSGGSAYYGDGIVQGYQNDFQPFYSSNIANAGSESDFYTWLGSDTLKLGILFYYSDSMGGMPPPAVILSENSFDLTVPTAPPADPTSLSISYTSNGLTWGLNNGIGSDPQTFTLQSGSYTDANGTYSKYWTQDGTSYPWRIVFDGQYHLRDNYDMGYDSNNTLLGTWSDSNGLIIVSEG